MILLRSALFNAWFFGSTLLMGMVAVFVRAFLPGQARNYSRFWCRTVLWGARMICGIGVQVTGLERLPTGPFLLASQHQSAFDTLIWVVLLPGTAYVYKSELAGIPLFGPMLPATGQIAIDRGASIGAVRNLLRETRRAIDEGRQIVIFPEGTRVAPGAESEIRAGFTLIASRSKLPIFPVATDSGHYWGRRAFRKRPGRIRIHVGEPISPALPPAELVGLLRQRWADAALGVNAVDNSVDRVA